MNARDGTVIVLLTLTALGSWYLARNGNDDSAEVTRTEYDHPGYYLKSARILGTGPDGSPLYEIEAARAEQGRDESILFSEVRVRYSPESDVPWRVDADTATLYPDTPLVLLEGHVRAVSAEGFPGNDTEIRTNVLALNPQTYIAETDERVQIRIGARSLTATGMLASLNDNRLELKSNVSGKFVP
ncbi:MAG: LPS export ABC transporter periplasmic protein LptC [Woeseiaceae bacterium]|nr:LPS export ABC transporter periplasmic protein LptC [Woeseiaceae bacterium]